MCAVYRSPGSTLGYRLSTPEHRGKVYLKAEPLSTRGDAAPSISPRTHRNFGLCRGISRRHHPETRTMSYTVSQSGQRPKTTLKVLMVYSHVLCRTSVRRRTEHKKGPPRDALESEAEGDCYYNNNIGATRSQGIWAFSLVILWLLISLHRPQ